ncbi:hypothetical protein BC829DRAFT_391100 [Chytridium lagenaria]|nr:hypothetical protein BC829DRAFT_391100 [Chytridium lagenaria]
MADSSDPPSANPLRETATEPSTIHISALAPQVDSLPVHAETAIKTLALTVSDVDSKDDLSLASLAAKDPTLVSIRIRKSFHSENNRRLLNLPRGDDVDDDDDEKPLSRTPSRKKGDTEGKPQIMIKESASSPKPERRGVEISNAFETSGNKVAVDGKSSTAASPRPDRKITVQAYLQGLEPVRALEVSAPASPKTERKAIHRGDPARVWHWVVAHPLNWRGEGEGQESPGFTPGCPQIPRSPISRRVSRVQPSTPNPVADNDVTMHSPAPSPSSISPWMAGVISASNSSLPMTPSESMSTLASLGSNDLFQEAVTVSILHLLQLRMHPWMSETTRGLQGLSETIQTTNNKLEDVETRLNSISLYKMTKQIPAQKPAPSSVDGPLMGHVEHKIEEDNMSKVGSSLAYKQMQKKLQAQKDEKMRAKKKFDSPEFRGQAPSVTHSSSGETDQVPRFRKTCPRCDGLGIDTKKKRDKKTAKGSKSCTSFGFVHPESELPTCAMGVRCANCANCMACEGLGLIKEAKSDKENSPLPSYLLAGGLLANKISAQRKSKMEKDSLAVTSPRLNGEDVGSVQTIDGTQSPHSASTGSGFHSLVSLNSTGSGGGNQTSEDMVPVTLV